MRGLIIEDGVLEIIDDTRVTFTSDGTLVNLLPSSYDLNLSNINQTFPDVPKSDAYYWSGQSNWSGDVNDPFLYSEGCSTAITAIPHNWDNFSAPLVLGAVPSSDIDFLDVLCYARRVNTPSNWMGAAIPIPIPANQWVDMGGASMIVEQALGLTRTVTPQISGGDVVLLAEQSVANAPTGYTTDPTFNTGITYGSNGTGIPVSARDAKERFNQPNLGFLYRRGGNNPCATSNNTNHSSQWRFDFRIAFGRRTQ